MTDTITFTQNEYKISAEVTDAGGPLKAAGAQDAAHSAEKSFRDAIGMVGALTDAFTDVFKGRKIGSAEISLGLKATVKGDFIIVGSSGEASLNLKLTLVPNSSDG